MPTVSLVLVNNTANSVRAAPAKEFGGHIAAASRGFDPTHAVFLSECIPREPDANSRRLALRSDLVEIRRRVVT